MLQLIEQLDEGRITLFCNLLCVLWKARNEEWFEGKKPTPEGVLAQAKAMHLELTEPNNQRAIEEHAIQVQRGTRPVLIDASWEVTRKIETRMLLFDNQGKLENDICQAGETHDPFHAKATALLQALTHLRAREPCEN